MTKEWGPCTWYLFHTLAEKIKEDQFIILRLPLINIITSICGNLPCPDCANHARQKMSSLNITNIKTKEDLKLMLLIFHNEVNMRNGKPLFNESDLNNKYSVANTNNIVQHFIQIWSKRTPNPKLLTVSFHKNQTLQNFINWWNTNHQYFNA